MKHSEKITRERILEILECKDRGELNDRIHVANYGGLIDADNIIYSIMFLWEAAGYVIRKKKN